MMTENIYIDIRFSGEGFSPKTLLELTSWPIEILAEAGEISKKGRYKGKISPYGIALLKIGNSIENILEWSNKLVSSKKNLELSNVNDIAFEIETSNEKLNNFSITPEISKNLSYLNAKINFNIIENDKIDELTSKLLLHLSQVQSIYDFKLVEQKLTVVKRIYANNFVSPEMTYGLIMYLLNARDQSIKEETFSLEHYLKEYNENE